MLVMVIDWGMEQDEHRNKGTGFKRNHRFGTKT